MDKMEQEFQNIFFELIDQKLDTDLSVQLRNEKVGFHKNNYLFRKEEIALVHIPSTGGNSLSELLIEHELLKVVNLFMHRPVACLRDPKDYNYITIMREPIERVWSFYQLILRSPPHFPYYSIAQKGLEYFLKQCWEVRNMACRYYSGTLKEPTELTLKQALTNLKYFFVIIDFRYFEIEVEKFLSIYDSKPVVVPIKKRNQFEFPSERARQMIAYYNALDIDLYRQWFETLKQ